MNFDDIFDSELVLKHGIVTPCVLIADIFVRTVARGPASTPTLHTAHPLQRTPNLAVKPFTTYQ